MIMTNNIKQPRHSGTRHLRGGKAALLAAAMLAMVSCAGSDTLSDGDTPAAPDNAAAGKAGVVEGAMASTIVFADGAGDNITSRSSIQYNRVENTMKATWETSDAIAVFPKSNTTSQIKFVLDSSKEQQESGTSIIGSFIPGDGGVSPIGASEDYISYSPYKAQTQQTGEFSYNAVPVSFEGQTQTANVKMNCYWQYLYGDASTKDAQYTKYKDSEKAAAAHLSDYNFMVSTATSTETKYVLFDYKRLSSIIRFYMYAPAAASEGVYYDSLVVVNNTKKFAIEATMDVANATLTAKRETNRMKLTFSPAIDMTNNSNSSLDTYDYWDQDYPDNGYIMAYMMIAPVDLTADATEKSTLYLIGHTETSGTKVKKYYKATLSKINFEAGKHHQWVVDSQPEQPITFTEVNVQTWLEDVYGNNGGSGTEGW